MRITASAISLSVDDVAGSAVFAKKHFRADGLLVVFVVEDVDGEYARLKREGVPITTPIETEPWGERYFQVSDPSGVVIQLVQWITERG